MENFKKTRSNEIFDTSNAENQRNDRLKELHLGLMPEFGESWNGHSLVTLNRQSLSRILYYDHLYKQLLGVPGVICEFGVQWGATLSLLSSLRGTYEPYNHSRKIIGFDTFEGFVNVDHNIDGEHVNDGDYHVQTNYEETLDEILSLQEANCPIPHIKKFELVKGDASKSVIQWLEQNPQTIIGMAIFDMDIYKPTRDVLEAIIPYLTKGSVLVFDELNCAAFPGETQAVREVLGLNNIKLQHFAHQPMCAWAIFE